MKTKKAIITTSWDDGHQLDLKLNHLLNKYNLKGTFYVPKQYPIKPGLKKNEIKEIAINHEIGAHGLSHTRLNSISLSDAKIEIGGSKKYLENLLNKPIKMFSYSGGLFNEKIKKIVQEEGYLGARTTKKFQIKEPIDFFALGVTNQVYPHPFRKKNDNSLHLSSALLQPLRGNFSGIRKFKLPIKAFFSWSEMMKGLFDYVCENNDVWHCWGHSWEIEKYNMWQDLENVFNYISNKENVLYLTNSQVLENYE